MATYYVATTGNDTTGDGSIGNPWQTIAKAVKYPVPAISAGDTVYIRGGIYKEYVVVAKTLSGTAENPTVISAYPGETVILEGDVVISDWTQCAADDTFLTVQEVVNPNYANIYWAKVHKDYLYNAASVGGTQLQIAANRQEIMLFENGTRCRIARYPNQTKTFGLDVQDPTNGEAPTGEDGTFIGVGPEATIPATNAYLRDNDGFLDKATGYWDGAWIDVHTQASNNNIERRTIASYTNEEGVRTATFDVALTYGNIARDNVTEPYALWSDDYSIVNHPHILDTPGEFAITTSYDEDGYYKVYLWPIDVANLTDKISYGYQILGFKISFSPASSYININNITMRKIRGYGVQFEGATGSGNIHTGHKVQGCTIYDTDGEGIYAIYADQIEINNCTFNNNKNRCVHFITGSNNVVSGCTTNNSYETNLSMWGQTDLKIVGNTVGSSVGFHGHSMILYSGCNRALIANNYMLSPTMPCVAFNTPGEIVFYGNTLISGSTYTMIAWSTGSGNLIFLNNILRSVGANSIVYATTESALLVNNVFNGSGITVGSGKVQERYYNLFTAVPAGNTIRETEIDGRAYSDSDLFVDSASANYRPNETGPLVGAGADISSYLSEWNLTTNYPTFDFTKDGNDNSWKASPSIGAYESAMRYHSTILKFGQFGVFLRIYK